MFRNDVAFCAVMALEGHILPNNSFWRSVCHLNLLEKERPKKSITLKLEKARKRIDTGTLYGWEGEKTRWAGAEKNEGRKWWQEECGWTDSLIWLLCQNWSCSSNWGSFLLLQAASLSSMSRFFLLFTRAVFLSALMLSRGIFWCSCNSCIHPFSCVYLCSVPRDRMLQLDPS